MRMSRRMGLYGGKLPTFAELFRTIDNSAYGGVNSSTAAILSHSMGQITTVGDPWIYFFCVGSSLEISHIEKTNNGFTKESLSLTAASGETAQGTTITSNGLISNNSLYAGFFLGLHFNGTYLTSIIDAMFRAATVTSPKYYYSSEQQSSHLLLKDYTTDYTGACLAAFRAATSASGTNSNNWSISDWTDPLVPIFARQDGTVLDRTVIKERVVATTGNYYYIPTITGSNESVYTRSYSLFKITETW